MNTLFLDTTDNKKILVKLTTEKGVDTVEENIEQKKAQVVLLIVKKLLKKHKLTIHDISQVEVNPGPGSFTGVRVGVSIANALTYALGISKDLVEPLY